MPPEGYQNNNTQHYSANLRSQWELTTENTESRQKHGSTWHGHTTATVDRPQRFFVA